MSGISPAAHDAIAGIARDPTPSRAR